MTEENNKKSNVGTDPYKGVRDFYPEDMEVQNYIFSTWKEVSESFKYQEYSASILEPLELYEAKSGDEIVHDQTYNFTDRGDRRVALRPEMTPTLARMVAGKRKSLKFPLRWFSIPNLFRYEKPQRGRKREHWQLNCDLVGIPGIEGDIEIISLAHTIMKKFGAKDEDFSIKMGNRSEMQSTLSKHKIPTENHKRIFQLIDREGKMPEDERQKELSELGVDFEIKQGDYSTELIAKLAEKNIKVQFDPKIARGFDYYTGMVFEVFDTNPENKRSLFGGGRYDNLLEIFGVEPVPTVGFGMGDITIRDFLETHGLPIRNNS